MAITLNSFKETVEKVVGKRPKDVFHSILQEGLEQEIVPARTKRAREYYRGFGAMALESSKETIFKNRDRIAKLPSIGRMYFFQYFPKMANELPYHDRLPMIFRLASGSAWPFSASRKRCSASTRITLTPICSAKVSIT